MNSPQTYTDADLVRLLREGNRAAFDTIYKTYWPTMYDTAYKRLMSREQTEDVVQDVFARIWAKAAQLEIQNLSAYLHTAVRYEVIRFVTRHKHAVEFYKPLEELLMESDVADRILMEKELFSLVRAYALTLPAKRREIFLLHVEQKLNTEEIAAQLGISRKTVQNQLNTAMTGLRKELIPIIIAFLASQN